MKRSEWRIVVIPLVCLVLMTGLGYGQDSDESASGLTGEVRFRYEYFGVDEDSGRFREDNWMTDESTGGLDWLDVKSNGPDENGYEWSLQGRALYDYDYDISFLAKKEDSHYFKFDFSSLRRYFDGSNEYWNESLYGLPGSSEGYGSIGGTSEHPDGGYHVDRRNYNIEFGLTPSEGPQWVFGWHRLEKDGEEVLGRGAQSKPINPDVGNFRGIPAVAQMRGITDTFYGEVSQTFAEKYNFRLRQEFEQYRDHQLIEFPRYKIDGGIGVLDQYRTFHDDPGYTNWRTMLMFDSFLDEETYVTGNYMYNYLKNDTTRDSIRPNREKESQRQHFIEHQHGSSRRTNVGAFGYRKENAFNVPKLRMSAGLRIEDSRTKSHGYGLSGGTKFRDAMSDLDEVRVAETFRLVYKGLDKTTLSFDADLEQRFLNWGEREDIQSHEIGDGPPHESARVTGAVNAGVGGYLERNADIDYTDQVYTFKAVHRHNRSLKSTVKFSYKDLERSYTERFDNDLIYYPGKIGNIRTTGGDLTLKTDIRLNSNASSTLMYQFVQESINTELGGKTANLEIHRGSGNLSFVPMQNMFLVATFMLENYQLDSPGNGGGTKIADGPRPFDYSGNSYSLLLDGTYAFNSKTSSTFGFQHTEAMGTVDYAGDYVYDKVSVALNHKFSDNETIGLGYQFINFNNHNGGDWDDYDAHGVYVTYGYTF